MFLALDGATLSINRACVEAATTTTNTPSGPLAASHVKSPCVYVCAHALSVYFYACSHVFESVLTRLLSFYSIPSVCFCSSVICCCGSHHPHLPTPPCISSPSLSLSLPHRLPITLHKAKITQATPFHLLSSSSSSCLFFLPS